MDTVYLLTPLETEPKQKLDFEIAESHIVDPSRILGQLAMELEHERELEQVLSHFKDTQRVIGQLAMELHLHLVVPVIGPAINNI